MNTEMETFNFIISLFTLENNAHCFKSLQVVSTDDKNKEVTVL